MVKPTVIENIMVDCCAEAVLTVLMFNMSSTV